MQTIPIFAFSAWSGTGKTTILEQLIPLLKQRGLRIAVLKHDAHDFEIDREGKDSWRFSHAGADITVISSSQKTALIEQRSLSVSDILSRIHDVDLILAEGYNDLSADICDPSADVSDPSADVSYQLYRIGISRAATKRGLRTPAQECIAVMTDDPDLALPSGARRFGLQDISGLADLILELL